MGLTGMYANLKALVAEVERDVEKASKGNNAARTRVRLRMQHAKTLAQEIRNEISNMRKEKERSK